MTAKAAQWWQDQCWLKLASGWENALSSFSLIKCLRCVNSDNNLGLPPLSSATTLYLLPTYISLPSSQKTLCLLRANSHQTSYSLPCRTTDVPTSLTPTHIVLAPTVTCKSRLGWGPWIVYVRLQFIGSRHCVIFWLSFHFTSGLLHRVNPAGDTCLYLNRLCSDEPLLLKVVQKSSKVCNKLTLDLPAFRRILGFMGTTNTKWQQFKY